MEWRVEEETQEHRTLVKHVYVDGEHVLEFRVLHDKIANRYILRIVKLRGFSHSEISLLSTLCANLDMSLDYSPSDKQVYLTPSPLKYIFSSLEELENKITSIVDVVRQVILYLRDVRAGSEIALELTRQGWLVMTEDTGATCIRKTFRLDKAGAWVIAEITAPGMFEAGRARIRLCITCRDASRLAQMRKLLIDKGFSIGLEHLDLGFLEAHQDVLTVGLTMSLVKEVEKLINELGQ